MFTIILKTLFQRGFFISPALLTKFPFGKIIFFQNVSAGRLSQANGLLRKTPA
jgi:hypothetical protein